MVVMLFVWVLDLGLRKKIVVFLFLEAEIQQVFCLSFCSKDNQLGTCSSFCRAIPEVVQHMRRCMYGSHVHF